MIINGKRISTPSLDITTWQDDMRLVHSSRDGRKRKTRWVRQIINHTMKGIPGGPIKCPQYIKPGGINKDKEYSVAQMWAADDRSASAHFNIDGDGSIGQLGDPYSWASYHAGSVNEFSIGVEMWQEGDGGIWQETLDACVALNLELCKQFGIQFQVHTPYLNGPFNRLMKGGKDCVGIFGHRDVTNNRGQGDPGDFIVQALIDAGADNFDFSKGEDLEVWKERQEQIGVLPDGIPGPQTVQALKEAGYQYGIYALGKGASETVSDASVKSFICKALGCC